MAQDRGGPSNLADIAAGPTGSWKVWQDQQDADLKARDPEGFELAKQFNNLAPIQYNNGNTGPYGINQGGPVYDPVASQRAALGSQLEQRGLINHNIHHDFGDFVSDTIGGAVEYGVPLAVGAAIGYGGLSAFGAAGAGAGAGAGEGAAASDLGMLGATSEGVSGGVGAVGVGAAPSYSMLGPAGIDNGTPIYSDAMTGGTGPVGADTTAGGAGLTDYDGSGSGGGPGGQPGNTGPQDYSLSSAPDAARFSSVGLSMDGGGLGLTSTASGASGGSAPFSMPSFISALKPSDWLSIAGGGLGLYESDQNRRLAKKAASMQDPFASQRGQYADKLAALSADPSTITNLPGYKFGLDQGNQALLRTTAARGYTGSGNEAIALQQYNQNYAQQWLTSEQTRLAQLAGGNAQPGGGNQLLQGNQYATDLMSKALASIGYGLGRWGY